jgi:signal transduction histidine kinase
MHLKRAAEAGALSASLAHDLDQPPVSIRLNAQKAEDLLKDRPVGELREAVVDIMHANDHAAGIIKQFGKLLKRRSTTLLAKGHQGSLLSICCRSC